MRLSFEVSSYIEQVQAAGIIVPPEIAKDKGRPGVPLSAVIVDLRLHSFHQVRPIVALAHGLEKAITCRSVIPVYVYIFLGLPNR